MGFLGYTELPDGYEKLVSDWMREQYHCEVKQEWVLFSPRINMALNMAGGHLHRAGRFHYCQYTRLSCAGQGQ